MRTPTPTLEDVQPQVCGPGRSTRIAGLQIAASDSKGRNIKRKREPCPFWWVDSMSGGKHKTGGIHLMDLSPFPPSRACTFSFTISCRNQDLNQVRTYASREEDCLTACVDWPKTGQKERPNSLFATTTVFPKTRNSGSELNKPISAPPNQSAEMAQRVGVLSISFGNNPG